jgi:hypothetical protein
MKPQPRGPGEIDDCHDIALIAPGGEATFLHPDHAERMSLT